MKDIKQSESIVGQETIDDTIASIIDLNNKVINLEAELAKVQKAIAERDVKIATNDLHIREFLRELTIRMEGLMPDKDALNTSYDPSNDNNSKLIRDYNAELQKYMSSYYVQIINLLATYISQYPKAHRSQQYAKNIICAIIKDYLEANLSNDNSYSNIALSTDPRVVNAKLGGEHFLTPAFKKILSEMRSLEYVAAQPNRTNNAALLKCVKDLFGPKGYNIEVEEYGIEKAAAEKGSLHSVDTEEALNARMSELFFQPTAAFGTMRYYIESLKHELQLMSKIDEPNSLYATTFARIIKQNLTSQISMLENQLKLAQDTLARRDADIAVKERFIKEELGELGSTVNMVSDSVSLLNESISETTPTSSPNRSMTMWGK